MSQVPLGIFDRADADPQFQFHDQMRVLKQDERYNIGGCWYIKYDLVAKAGASVAGQKKQKNSHSQNWGAPNWYLPTPGTSPA